MLSIYIPQNGQELMTALNAVVSMLSQETFTTARDIVLTLAVLITGVTYIKGAKVASIVKHMLTTIFCLYGLLGIKTTVNIVDMQTMDSASTPMVVANVPLGIALPSSIFSELGYGMTRLFSDVFHMPDSLDYNKSGMIFGARTWMSSTKASLSTSPELSADISSFIRQCVFSAKLLASHQLTPNDLIKSTDLKSTLFNSPSKVYRVITHDGRNLSCADAAAELKSKMPEAAKKEITSLALLKAKGDETKYKNTLSAANQYYMGISKTAADIITQNTLINEIRNAQADAFSFAGADAALMNYTNSASMQKMHVSEANSFWLASYRLPYYMASFWILTICIFPLVFLISLIPATNNVYKTYLQSQVYLWSWPPMFIIIHFLVSMASSGVISILGTKSGGITFSTVDDISNLHNYFAYTAAALAGSVPFLAYYIVKGLAAVLGPTAQYFGGLAQSVSMSEAQSAAQGNISYASYSGWNMNYDNTNAHKHDTNIMEAHGKASVQMDSGAMLSRNADNSRTMNAQPAISHSAVDIHGSERVADSIQQSANEYFNSAEQHRTAGDKHLQAGLSQLENYSENNANDIRKGSGLSSSAENSYSQDIRKMKDIAHAYNEHHSHGGSLSGEAHISVKASSDDHVLGKLAKWTVGVSGEAGGSARTSYSFDQAHQNFINSSEGKAFAEAYNHLTRTAQSNHLDATDSSNLSESEQIALNLSQGSSLIEQASAEYSRGQQLSHTASHAREQSSSINSNLNQPFHDYVSQHHGIDGETVLSKTNMESVNQQNQWANDFLNSKEGKSAITLEANKLIGESQSSLKSSYESTSSSIKSQFNNQQNSLQHQYDDTAAHKKSTASFSKISKEQAQLGKQLSDKNRGSNLQVEHDSLSLESRKAIKNGNNEISKQYNKNEKG